MFVASSLYSIKSLILPFTAPGDIFNIKLLKKADGFSLNFQMELSLNLRLERHNDGLIFVSWYDDDDDNTVYAKNTL